MGLVQLIQPGSGTWAWGVSGVWGTGAWGDISDLVYTFPDGLSLKDNSFETRLDKQKLTFAHGRFTTGGEVDDRGPIVEGTIEVEARSDLRQLLNDMRVQCQMAKRLRIDTGSFLNLAKLYRFQDEPEKGFDWTVSRLRIEWQCDDPFWHSEAETTVTRTVSGDGTFTVDLTGMAKCVQGQHPRIKITSPIYLPVTTLQLTNTTDASLTMRYGDPNLGFGNSATIDCASGTCARSDGENTLRYFQGEWLRLVDGLNTFAYVGPACTIDFTWRHRWL
jgi:hypothetical protein